MHFDFGGFDFGGGSAGGTNFRDLFSQFFRGGGGAAEAPRDAEPGSDLEYQIEISFWEAVRGTVKKLDDHSPGDLHRRATARARSARRKYATACGGSGQVTQTSGKMRFNLACPRCGGTGRMRTICRDLRRRRPRAPRRYDRGAHSRGRANRLARARRRPRQRRHAWRAAGRSLHHHRGAAASLILTGAATISTPSCPSRLRKRRWAPRSKCPRSTAARCCACRREPTADRSFACGKRACRRFARHGQRGDLYVELQVVVPKPVDERVRESAEGTREARAGRSAPRPVRAGLVVERKEQEHDGHAQSQRKRAARAT